MVASLAAIFLVRASKITQSSYVAPEGWSWIREVGAVQAIGFQNGETLVAGALGLSAITGGKTRRIPISDSIEGLVLFSVLPIGEEELVVGHQEGLVIRSNGVWTHVKEIDGSLIRMVRALYLDASQTLWIGSEDGLYAVSWPLDQGKLKFKRKLLERNIVRTILPMTQQQLWVGTMSGLYLLSEGAVDQRWDNTNGLPDRSVNALIRDRETGGIWAGLGFDNKGGAVGLVPDGITFKLSKVISGSKLAGAKVRSMMLFPNGQKWFGHEFDGLTIQNLDGSSTLFRPDKELPNREVTVIHKSQDGSVMLGTLDGVVNISASAVGKLNPSSKN